jgi:hypothetical protein
MIRQEFFYEADKDLHYLGVLAKSRDCVALRVSSPQIDAVLVFLFVQMNASSGMKIPFRPMNDARLRRQKRWSL